MGSLEPWHLALGIVAMLGTAGVTLFIGGKWVGRIEQIWREMSQAMSDWRDDRKRLSELDVHRAEIDQLKETLKGAMSRLETMWQKLFSHEKHIAVLRATSSHDLGGDSDPPKGL